jgi:CHAD domain-containing protein
MSAVLERERKYELAEVEALPDLERIPGVRVSGEDLDTLDAVYFDAADLRLARAGITLRRRSGGPDAGWHLKLPSGVDTRTEFHAPLAEEPPGELTGLVAGILRGAPVEPVARISTVRHRRRLLDDGGVLAEVTDDHVTGQPAGPDAVPTEWREVEVELAERADAALLDRVEEFLVDSGLRRSSASSKLQRVLAVSTGRPAPERRSTAGEAVLAYLHEQVAALNRQDIAVRRGADDAIHQLRVAARRLRSALRVFRKIIEGSPQIQDDLRWLGEQLGPARDLEVLEERFRTAVAQLPDELVLGSVTARLTRSFGPDRAAADRTARQTLDTTRYFRLREQLDALLAAPPLTERANRKRRKEIAKRVRRAYRKVAQRMDAMTALPPGPDRDTATHRVRKAAKRLRYAAEVAGRKVKPAKRFTKVLGEYQDSVVARPRLRELGVAAHLAGDNAFTFGVLTGQERATMPDVLGAWNRLRESYD